MSGLHGCSLALAAVTMIVSLLHLCGSGWPGEGKETCGERRIPPRLSDLKAPTAVIDLEGHCGASFFMV